jgi:hypothetical protein
LKCNLKPQTATRPNNLGSFARTVKLIESIQRLGTRNVGIQHVEPIQTDQGRIEFTDDFAHFKLTNVTELHDDTSDSRLSYELHRSCQLNSLDNPGFKESFPAKNDGEYGQLCLYIDKFAAALSAGSAFGWVLSQ